MKFIPTLLVAVLLAGCTLPTLVQAACKSVPPFDKQPYCLYEPPLPKGWLGEPKPSWWPADFPLIAGAGLPIPLSAEEQQAFIELTFETGAWDSAYRITQEKLIPKCSWERRECNADQIMFVRHEYMNWVQTLVEHPEKYPLRAKAAGGTGNPATGGTGNPATGGTGNPATGGTGNPASGGGALVNPLGDIDSLEDLLRALLRAVVTIGSILLTLAIIWVGFKFVVAQGNEEKLKEARGAFVWVVIGGLILLGAEAISLVIQETVSGLGS